MLFEYCKKHLPGKQFATDADVKQVVTSWLRTPHTNFFHGRMQALVATVGQMLNVYGTGLMGTIRCHVLSIHWNQNNVLGIRLFVTFVFLSFCV
jgi:hypothetical protein